MLEDFCGMFHLLLGEEYKVLKMSVKKVEINGYDFSGNIYLNCPLLKRKTD